MRQKVNYVLIGAFVLISTLVTVIGAVVLGAGALTRNALILETYLTESVTGLDVGAHVRFRGVKIGEVIEIGFTTQVYESAQEPLVLVRFSIDPREPGQDKADLAEIVEERLGEGMRARLASQGLTGALYLEADLYEDADLRYPPIQHEWDPTYAYVPAIRSTINTLSVSAERVLGNLAKTDFPGLVDQLKATLQTFDDSISQADLPALARQLREVLDRAQTTIEGFNEGINGLNDEGSGLFARIRRTLDALDPDDLRAIVGNVREFSGKLGPVANNLTQTLASVEALVHGRGRDIDSILDNVRRIAAAFGNLADTLEQYPSLLLFGDPPPRTRR